jgi:hypothetical protein
MRVLIGVSPRMSWLIPSQFVNRDEPGMGYMGRCQFAEFDVRAGVLCIGRTA